MRRGGVPDETGPSPAALETMEGRNLSAEVHVGPLQLVAALSTHLQLLRRELDSAETGRVDHMLEICAAATAELRQLMARLEPPAADETLLTGLAGSACRVLGADVDVVDGTGGSLAPPLRSAVLGLAHRALLEMRRSGGRAPGRIEVSRQGGGVAARSVLSAGGEVMRLESTLPHRARLLGGSADMTSTPCELVVTIGLPGM